MGRDKPEPIRDLLEHGALGQISAEAKARRETTDRVRDLLPPAEGRELIAAHVSDDGTLTLLMSSAAWADRVRYRAEELGASKLTVRVAPRGASP